MSEHEPRSNGNPPHYIGVEGPVFPYSVEITELPDGLGPQQMKYVKELGTAPYTLPSKISPQSQPEQQGEQ